MIPKEKSPYGPEDAKVLASTGMKQREIAEKLGVSHNTISRWKMAGWKRVSDEKAVEAEFAKQHKAVIASGKAETDDLLMSARLAQMNADVSKLNETDLLKETARRTLVTVCHALEYGQANAGVLVKSKPRDFGAFLTSCGMAVSHAHAGWDRYLEILRGLHGEPAPVTPVSAEMDESDPMREIVRRIEANDLAKKKAAEAVPGPKSVQ